MSMEVQDILDPYDLDQFIFGDVLEPEGDEAKANHKKNLAKARRIIADSIKDHLIPHVSAFKTPKDVDVFVTSKCNHLYISYIVFDYSLMFLSRESIM